MFPHTAMHAIYVSSYSYIWYICIRIRYICYVYVLILLYMCPHTAVCYICVFILLYMCQHTAIHAIYVSSYCYMYIYSGKARIYILRCDKEETADKWVRRWHMLTYADVCWRMLTYAAATKKKPPINGSDVCWRMLTYADVCWRMLTYPALRQRRNRR
jgi:hypothetical protein